MRLNLGLLVRVLLLAVLMCVRGSIAFAQPVPTDTVSYTTRSVTVIDTEDTSFHDYWLRANAALLEPAALTRVQNGEIILSLRAMENPSSPRWRFISPDQAREAISPARLLCDNIAQRVFQLRCRSNAEHPTGWKVRLNDAMCAGVPTLHSLTPSGCHPYIVTMEGRTAHVPIVERRIVERRSATIEAPAIIANVEPQPPTISQADYAALQEQAQREHRQDRDEYAKLLLSFQIVTGVALAVTMVLFVYFMLGRKKTKGLKRLEETIQQRDEAISGLAKELKTREKWVDPEKLANSLEPLVGTIAHSLGTVARHVHPDTHRTVAQLIGDELGLDERFAQERAIILKEIDQLLTRHVAGGAPSEELRARIDAVSRENRSLRDVLAARHPAISDDQNLIESLTQQRDESERDIVRLRRTIEAMESAGVAAATQARETIAARDQTITHLKDRVAALEEELKRCTLVQDRMQVLTGLQAEIIKQHGTDAINIAYNCARTALDENAQLRALLTAQGAETPPPFRPSDPSGYRTTPRATQPAAQPPIGRPADALRAPTKEAPADTDTLQIPGPPRISEDLRELVAQENAQPEPGSLSTANIPAPMGITAAASSKVTAAAMPSGALGTPHRRQAPATLSGVGPNQRPFPELLASQLGQTRSIDGPAPAEGSFAEEPEPVTPSTDTPSSETEELDNSLLEDAPSGLASAPPPRPIEALLGEQLPPDAELINPRDLDPRPDTGIMRRSAISANPQTPASEPTDRSTRPGTVASHGHNVASTRAVGGSIDPLRANTVLRSPDQDHLKICATDTTGAADHVPQEGPPRAKDRH